MSHFFTFFTNENGIVTDPSLADEIAKAMSPPFNFSSAFIYSHGWWTDANSAANDYNRFSIGFASQLLADRAAANSQLAAIPAASLSTGIHWPSTISENGGFLSDLLEPATFFTMETRADDVGQTGVNGLLLAILGQWQSQGRVGQLTINLLGHSFGTKVVCSALQSLVASTAGNPGLLASVRFNVVLLQAAFDNDDFEPDQLYCDVPGGIPNLRVLASKSNLDTALGTAYPRAHLLEFFKKTNRIAMGFAGPTANTESLFGGADQLAITPGINFSSAAAFAHRLVVADLTPLHAANPSHADASSGHHSDIYYPEIYSLIGRFIY
jgi:hypothetical protein